LFPSISPPDDGRYIPLEKHQAALLADSGRQEEKQC
jgi:hypothetical protein